MRKLAFALLAGCMTVGAAGAVSAFADGPGTGAPSIVAVGDSAISGEAGRWAGNTNGSSVERGRPRPDRVLRQCVRHRRDESEAATAPRPPRSPSAAAWSRPISPARARARTRSRSRGGSDFKPGLDFYDDGAGHIGQAKALQQYASTHNVKMVVALIGANNYGFADIVQQCVQDWLLSPSWWPELLQRRLEHRRAKFTAANIASIHDERRERLPATCAPRCATPATPTRSGHCSRRPTRRLFRMAHSSDTRRAATRGRASAAAVSGTGTPTGRTTPSCRR